MNKAYQIDYEKALKYSYGDEFILPHHPYLSRVGVNQDSPVDLLPHLAFADYLEENGKAHLAHIVRAAANLSDDTFEGNRFIHRGEDFELADNPIEIGHGEITSSSLHNIYGERGPLDNHILVQAKVYTKGGDPFVRPFYRYVVRGTAEKIQPLVEKIKEASPQDAKYIQQDIDYNKRQNGVE